MGATAATIIARRCACSSSTPRPSRRPTTAPSPRRWPARGAEVELLTSRFLYGPVPAAGGLSGARVLLPPQRRAAASTPPPAVAFKAAEHLGDMRRLRAALDADVVHYQWLTDRPPSTPTCCRRRRPRVLTAHYILPPAPSRRQVRAQPVGSSAAWTPWSPTPSTAPRRLRDEVGLDPDRVRVIPHGAFDYLTRLPEEKPLPAELEGAEGPVILFFGLLRPYKGLDVLLEAFAEVEGAELWIVGNPRMDRRAAARPRPPAPRAASASSPASSRTPRSRRSSAAPTSLVLPYRDAEHSGVLYTGLAFGKPMVLSAVGGFPEVAATGAARLVPPEDPGALAEALSELIADPAARERLAESARAGRRRPLLLGRCRRPHPRPLPSCELARMIRRDLLDLRRADRLHPPRLPAAAADRSSTLGAGRAARRRELDRAADRLADRRRLRRGGGDRRQGRQRARPRLPARAARADRRLRRLRRRHGRARPRRRRRPRPRAARAAASSPPRTPPPSRPPARSSPSPTPTAPGSPTPCASLVAPFAEPAVGYACGQVRFLDPEGDNLEGAYWRYEMAVREMESALAGITAGNGAIYAVRGDDYLPLGPSGSHDLSFPFAARQARPALALRPAGARRGEDGADAGGRVRRANGG